MSVVSKAASGPTQQPFTERLGLWPARITWFMLPVLAGPALSQGLDDLESAVGPTAEVMMWAGWFVGFVALLAPSTVSLTIYRVLAPVPLVALVSVLVGAGGVSAGLAMLAGVGSAAAFGVAFLALTGDEMVNGSAYGPERRLALRPPAALLLGPILLAWILMVSTAVAGPLLLADRRWLIGFPVTLAAGLFAYRGARSLHQLARRWIVFTPAGFVIHDYFVLAESVLLRRQDIAALGPAPAEPRGTVDISGGAMGLALQVESKDAINIAVRDGRSVNTIDTVRMIFSPTLPGQLLREARVRGISIS